MEQIILKPVGYVRNQVTVKKDQNWGEDVSVIELKEEFRGGLTGLQEFSHAIILCHLDKAGYRPEKHLLRRPRNRADMPMLGIFPREQRIIPIRSVSQLLRFCPFRKRPSL